MGKSKKRKGEQKERRRQGEVAQKRELSSEYLNAMFDGGETENGQRVFVYSKEQAVGCPIHIAFIGGKKLVPFTTSNKGTKQLPFHAEAFGVADIIEVTHEDYFLRVAAIPYLSLQTSNEISERDLMFVNQNKWGKWGFDPDDFPDLQSIMKDVRVIQRVNNSCKPHQALSIIPHPLFPNFILGR